MKRMLLCHGLAAAFLLGAVPFAGAQDYPTRPVRVVAPFAPGGGTDITSRILADGMSQVMGQTFVVDNRPGAGSVLGTDIVAKATPDGHTVLVTTISMAFNVALYKKLPFDTLRDLAPITLVADQPNILVAHPSLPAKTLPEFIALARAQPGKLNYGSAGIGSGTHLAMELLLLSQKADLVHVPYKGTGPALTAVLGNEINAFFSTFASALPHVKSGRVHAIAVTSAKRADALPQVPTVAEQGVSGYDYSTWYGLLAPGSTPRPIINRLNQAALKVLATPEIRKRYTSQGLNPRSMTPDEFAAYVRSETEKWVKVVRAAKIPLQ